MAGDSSTSPSSTTTTNHWALFDMVDNWCQHLPSCGGGAAASPWVWSSPTKKEKSLLDTGADNDTVATASTTQPDEEEEASSSALDSPVVVVGVTPGKEEGGGTRRAVTFGTLQVREYERIVDSTIYMGLSLGWDCTDHTPQPIIPPPTAVVSSSTSSSPSQPSTHHHSSSSSTGATTTGAGGDTLHVCKKHNGERFAIFLAYGFTRKELKAEASKAAKFWRQRQLEIIRKEEEQMALEATTKRVESRKKKAVNSAMGDSKAGTTSSSKRRAILFSMFRH